MSWAQALLIVIVVACVRFLMDIEGQDEYNPTTPLKVAVDNTKRNAEEILPKEY